MKEIKITYFFPGGRSLRLGKEEFLLKKCFTDMTILKKGILIQK